MTGVGRELWKGHDKSHYQAETTKSLRTDPQSLSSPATSAKWVVWVHGNAVQPQDRACVSLGPW